MFRLFAVFMLAFEISFIVLWLTSGVAIPLHREMLAAFVPIVMMFAALSFAFFSYLDGISKDLPSLKKDSSESKYKESVDAIGALRREVVVNIGLVLLLLMLEKSVLGVQELSDQQKWDLPEEISWALVSFRLACLFASLAAAGVQLHGLVIANQLRDLIAQHVKPKA